MPRSLADPARATLPPLAAAGLVELTTAERELAPGVRIHAAAGHTPGHVVVGIESAGERGLYVGDAIFHVANAIRPDWACVYDVDAIAAISTRRRLLEEASRDGRLVIAAHLETPGTVEAGSFGYRFLPLLDA
jgi:glyoxylase-like metal-dependent hydrolase (beta-lactamase superfamily II)